MPTVDVVTTENQKKGQVELAPAVFGVPVRPHLLHAEVRRQLARRHRGTHATRNRSGVSGGGAKPWRQKGTGRARQGTNRAPQWEGGGVVFGPVPRDYGHALPKKVRRAALRGALSHKAAESAITVVEEFTLAEPRTRFAAEVLRALGVADANVLLVLAERDDAVERATRNLPRVRTLRAAGLNVYDVLWAGRLVITRAALDAIEARLQGEAAS